MNYHIDTFGVNDTVVPALFSCPAILLAGGRGTRLHELTERESKPALPFGDHARLADFSISNAFNSGIRHLMVATQYQPWGLHAHLAKCWGRLLRDRGRVLDMRHGPSVTRTNAGYAGTAAAVTANLAHIDALAPRDVLILAADHVYRMDYRPMLAAHRASGADLTLAAAPVPRAEASGFGIVDAGADGQIRGFLEKPADPPSMPGDPACALASMGIYVFRWAALREALWRDRNQRGSRHDFGFDIVPGFVAAGRARAHAFEHPVAGEAPYWRDVGTLDAYRKAHLELLAPTSALARTEAAWPVLPHRRSLRPGHPDRFVAASAEIGRGVMLRGTVVLAGARIGEGSRLRDCILGPGAMVDPGTVIGEDAAEDALWFRRSPGGTVLVTAAMLEHRRARQCLRLTARAVGQPG